MRVIIDRFEGDFAVVEISRGVMADMPRILLPEGAKEGDAVDISVQQEETGERQEKIKKLMDNVWN